MIEFDVRRRCRGITIRVAPELAADLVILLDALRNMMREIKVKAEFQEAIRKSKLVSLKKRQEREFDRKSLDVFSKYQEYLAAADSHQAARLRCKVEFQVDTLGGVDIYLVRGRQLTRKTRKRPRADRGEAKNQFIELKEAA